MNRRFTLKELLEEALKSDRHAWHSTGRLNLTYVARETKFRGHFIPQSTLFRLVNEDKIPEHVVTALNAVFKIPKSLLRGEEVTDEMQTTLTDCSLSTLLLAKKIESLPKDAYHAIADQVDLITRQQQTIKESQKDHQP